MRLAVLSDLHLGKRQYRTDDGFINKYEKAGYDKFNEAITHILAYNPDMLIYCGDIFETANPSILALSKFYEGLSKLKKVPSLLILGNHDFSFGNKHTDCSALSTVLRNNKTFDIKRYAEYTVQHYVHDDTLFVLAPYVYDKLENLSSFWAQCEQLCTQHADLHRILVTHGITEAYGKRHPELGDKYVVPDSLVRQFDEVFIGHIHTPFEYKDSNTLVISPGALIDYQAYENRTGPLFFDTETRRYYREILDTPHIIKKTVDAQGINKLLRNAGEYIYNLTYTGDMDTIDNDLFIKAKNRAINITVSLEKPAEQNITKALNTNFYAWLAESHADKLEQFNKARAELYNSEEA